MWVGSQRRGPRGVGVPGYCHTGQGKSLGMSELGSGGEVHGEGPGREGRGSM